MRNEETILESLVKTGAGCLKTICKKGSEISVCQIKTRANYPIVSWNAWNNTSIEEVWTYKAGMLQTYERLTAKKDGVFMPDVKVTHQYKLSDDKDYDIEETIITETPHPKTYRVETRFRRTGSKKMIGGSGADYNETYSKTYLGNLDELLPVTDGKANKIFNEDYYDHVVFESSGGMNRTINTVRVSTSSGIGEYSKSKMRIGPSSFGIANIKKTDEICKWATRHPLHPELPVAKFYGNRVTIFDYEWWNTKYGAARFTHVRTLVNDMERIVKYSAVADALNGEYEPPKEECCLQSFPRTPYVENIYVNITEGRYKGSCFSFYVRPMTETDVDIMEEVYGFKPEYEIKGYVVSPFRQFIKLTMNGDVPSSKRTIELKSVEKIDVPKTPFIVRSTEHMHDAILNFISVYEIDTTYLRASETFKYVLDDGTIKIQETEYMSPNMEDAEALPRPNQG